MLNKNATTAIHSIAEAQIKILNALINVMETVVALEGLTKDNNDNGEFDINDLFPKPDQWELDPNFLKSVNDILGNKGIVKELKNYNFDNGKTLYDFFIDIAKNKGKNLQTALEKYGIKTQEDFFDLIKQFEGEYDWDTNAETLYKALKDWIPDKLSYEDEQVKTITIDENKAPIKVDFKE